MSVEKLKAAIADTKESYADIQAGHLVAVCEPLALGLPLAKDLLALAKQAAEADPERVISISVAVHGRPLLAAAEKGAGQTPAKKS